MYTIYTNSIQSSQRWVGESSYISIIIMYYTVGSLWYAILNYATSSKLCYHAMFSLPQVMYFPEVMQLGTALPREWLPVQYFGQTNDLSMRGSITLLHTLVHTTFGHEHKSSCSRQLPHPSRCQRISKWSYCCEIPTSQSHTANGSGNFWISEVYVSVQEKLLHKLLTEEQIRMPDVHFLDMKVGVNLVSEAWDEVSLSNYPFASH